MDNKNQLQILLEQLLCHIQPEKVVVFGSYASDAATPTSDIDLLIIWDSDLPRDQRQEIISRALRPRRIPMDILAYTPAEVTRCQRTPGSFVAHILATGKVLYERAGA